MKTFKDFIIEKSNIKDVVYAFIKSMLDSIGCSTEARNGSTIVVYTPDRDRSKRGAYLQDLLPKCISQGAQAPADVSFKFETGTKGSQISCYFDGDCIKILAKPAKKSSDGTLTKMKAGLDNEDRIVLAVRQLTGAKDEKDMSGTPINIVFTAKAGHKAPFTVNDVVNCKGVGKETQDRKKADIKLITKNGIEVPISIKKDNAEIWESSDTYFGPVAKDIFERLDLMAQISYAKEKQTVVTSKRGKTSKEERYSWKLDKGSEIKVKITDPKIIKDVCFGSDILGSGFIVQKTFTTTPLEFKDDKNGIRTFMCPVSFLAMTVDEIVKSSHCVYLLIRNDADRANASMGYRGLRVIVMMGDRRRNAKEIDISKLPPLSKLQRELVRSMSESAE